jgi:hypothetical protein
MGQRCPVRKTVLALVVFTQKFEMVPGVVGGEWPIQG